MNALPQIQPLASDLSERTLTLNLIIKGPEFIAVRSCEVLGRGFRNRVSFQNLGELEERLVGRLATAIRSCLQSIPDGAHVLALPEFLVELPGLALSGVHVLIMKAKDGARNAIFRFKEFMGSINNAFLCELGFNEPAATHSEKLAVKVLADICIPIMNLAQSFEHLNLGADRRTTIQMQDRAREFAFQTELLKRFIFNAGIGHAEPAEICSDAPINDPIRRLMR
ncbi:MAG: hypothetical protein AB8B47_03645 [Roseobacter sp.]